jgi:hypothetical protein
VLSVALSPDGTHIVSGSNDQMLRLWDMALQRPVGGPIAGHKGLVNSVAFSPDGTRIISGSDDLTVRVWPAPKIWPDILCAKLTCNMSHIEWRELVSSDVAYRVQCPGLPIPPDEPVVRPSSRRVSGLPGNRNLAPRRNGRLLEEFPVLCRESGCPDPTPAPAPPPLSRRAGTPFTTAREGVHGHHLSVCNEQRQGR